MQAKQRKINDPVIANLTKDQVQYVAYCTHACTTHACTHKHIHTHTHTHTHTYTHVSIVCMYVHCQAVFEQPLRKYILCHPTYCS